MCECVMFNRKSQSTLGVMDTELFGLQVEVTLRYSRCYVRYLNNSRGTNVDYLLSSCLTLWVVNGATILS
jgi:hypothetical protein